MKTVGSRTTDRKLMPTKVRTKRSEIPPAEKPAVESSIPKTPDTSNIEKLFEAGKLKEALDSFLSFLKRCDDTISEIAHLKGRLSGYETEEQANLIGAEGIITRNKISFDFQNVLLRFRKDSLAKHFDTRGEMDFLNSIRERDEVMDKILDLRLLPKNYQRDPSWGKLEGNSSIIFRLFNPDLRRHAIIMVVKMPTIPERMKQEIGQLADLRHRNIIKLLDFEIEQFPFFVITEYIHGENLPNALKVVGARQPAQVADWLFQLTDALDYLRHKRILHTNVRPSKIYIDDEWQLMISPFDLMLLSGKKDKSGTEYPGELTFSRYRDVCQYGSPEMLQADGMTLEYHRMHVSDMYSIGLIGYKMLTGQDLFAGASLFKILENRRQIEQDENLRTEKLAQLPAGNPLSEIIIRLLQIDPEDRKKTYQNLHHLLRELSPLTRAAFDEASLARQSYRRCLATNREFIRDFYQEFTKMTSSDGKTYQHYFNPDALKRQYAMLQMAVDILLDLDKREADFVQLVQPSHPKHGKFKAQDFEKFITLLLEMVKANDQLHWNSTYEASWDEIRKNAFRIIRQAHP